MKRPKRSTKEFTGEYEFPAYPYTATEILAWIRSGLQGQHKRRVTYKTLGLWTGQLETTAHYWWSQSLHPHLIALMCLLEQMSPRLRNDLFAKYLRLAPSLDHPMFAHDLRNLSLLFQVLRRRSGLTLITGGTDSERTFILCALANAFTKLGPRRNVTGLDLHRPAKFVPVSGMYYIDADPNRRKRVLAGVWPQIESSRAPLLLFNQAWSALPEQRAQILAWTKKRHVILAEAHVQHFPELKVASHGPVQTLEVSASSAFPSGIQISKA